MFKVICINKGTCDNPRMPQPEVGEICTVVEVSDNWFDGVLRYDLAEYDPSRYCYAAKNFIPLSSIDETEMERNYKTEKV